MSFRRQLMIANAMRAPEAFTLLVSMVAGKMTFGMAPRWNTGGFCHVDWGDGTASDATTSGAWHTHEYAEVGEYIVAITADVYALQFNQAVYAQRILDCNFNWSALGTLTDAGYMFSGAYYARYVIQALPNTVTGCQGVYLQNNYASMGDWEFPSGIRNAREAFRLCKATGRIVSLPASVTSIHSLANNSNVYIDLDDWRALNPTGWPALTTANQAFLNDVHVTGDATLFMEACPNCTDWTNAFVGTSCTNIPE